MLLNLLKKYIESKVIYTVNTSTFNINIPGHISPPEKIFYPEDIDETLRPFKFLPLCDSQRMQISPFNKCSCPSFHSV